MNENVKNARNHKFRTYKKKFPAYKADQLKRERVAPGPVLAEPHRWREPPLGWWEPHLTSTPANVASPLAKVAAFALALALALALAPSRILAMPAGFRRWSGPGRHYAA